MQEVHKFSASFIMQLCSLVCLVFFTPALYADTLSRPIRSAPPIAISSGDLEESAIKGYRVWFEPALGRGDIIEYDILPTGEMKTSVKLNTTPAGALPTNIGSNWSAMLQLQSRTATDRDILFFDKTTGTTAPFLWDNLPGALQSLVGDRDIVNYVRGDRSLEMPSGPFRQRTSLLGDISHSDIALISTPNEPYYFNSYENYIRRHLTREKRILVGANDGMVHMFDAASGEEVMAYVPSMVMGNLNALTKNPYQHTFFVDGPIIVRDAFFSGQWRTLAIGTLGAGGKGVFALDVTNPTKTGTKVLWEIDESDIPELGFTLSRPNLVRLSDGNFYVAIANGYFGDRDKASLLLLDPATGALVRKLSVRGGPSGNGLSTPAFIDSDYDTKMDYAFAGDLQGNLYRFDFSSPDAVNWRTDLGGGPIYRGSPNKPITQEPEVTHDLGRGILISFSTGQLLTNADLSSTTTQSVYGIWNNSTPVQNDSNLITHRFSDPRHYTGGVSTQTVRTLINTATPDPTSGPSSGWRVDLPSSFQIVSNPVRMRAGRMKVTMTNVLTAENWVAEFDYKTGGPAKTAIFDLNLDQELNNTDLLPGGTSPDVPMAWRKNTGFLSGPTVASLGPGKDLIVRNTLGVIPGTGLTAAPPGVDPCITDPLGCTGSVNGAHIDIVVYDEWGNDKYVEEGHRYDDDHGRSFVDVFDINNAPGDSSWEDLEDFKLNDPFLILVTNADLSPGGYLQIGNKTWNVLEYQKMIHQALRGWDGTSALLSPSGDPLILTENTIKAAGGTVRVSFDPSTFVMHEALVPNDPACILPTDYKDLDEVSDDYHDRWREGGLTLQFVRASTLSARAQAMHALKALNPTDLPATSTYYALGSSTKTSVHLKEGGVTYGGLILNDENASKAGLLYELVLYWHAFVNRGDPDRHSDVYPDEICKHLEDTDHAAWNLVKQELKWENLSAKQSLIMDAKDTIANSDHPGASTLYTAYKETTAFKADLLQLRKDLGYIWDRISTEIFDLFSASADGAAMTSGSSTGGGGSSGGGSFAMTSSLDTTGLTGTPSTTEGMQFDPTAPGALIPDELPEFGDLAPGPVYLPGRKAWFNPELE